MKKNIMDWIKVLPISGHGGYFQDDKRIAYGTWVKGKVGA